jgi:hypothetical protein
MCNNIACKPLEQGFSYFVSCLQLESQPVGAEVDFGRVNTRAWDGSLHFMCVSGGAIGAYV